jgi:hypothetical protein
MREKSGRNKRGQIGEKESYGYREEECKKGKTEVHTNRNTRKKASDT